MKIFIDKKSDVLAGLRPQLIETVKEIVQEAKPVQNAKSVNWQSSPVIPETDDIPF